MDVNITEKNRTKGVVAAPASDCPRLEVALTHWLGMGWTYGREHGSRPHQWGLAF
jgi:hypothetical protein